MIPAHRYADRSRTLEPPPRPDDGPGPAARTWRARAWLRTLEGDPAVDERRLARGRAYARSGAVGAVTVAPGRAVAYVRGSRARPYRVALHLRELTRKEWAVLLDAVADEPAHVAAVLDGDLPHRPVAAAQAAGVDLLPVAGELVPACSCPDAGHPCKHGAALCLELARHLDDDPFVLLLLRGRGKQELLDDLGRRAAAQTAEAARPQPSVLPTVPAARVWADPARPPLPDPLPVPAGPGRARPFPPGTDDADADDGTSRPRPARARGRSPEPTDPDGLDFLVTDAAARAHAYLTGARPSPAAESSLREEAVRLAAGHPALAGRGAFSVRFARLAECAHMSVAALARAAAAWRHGGPAGLEVLQTAWDPPAGDFDRARSALTAAGFPRTVIDRNRLTSGGVQLRYGRDGRWYPYREDPRSRETWPAGDPEKDPLRALHTARHA